MSEQIRERIYSIDFLRGVVMMIMLLDHTRDFVHHGAFLSDPTEPVTTNVPLFFTRWITHYCAPTFVFLSGISIYLQKMNGKSTGELSRFLFTRGLWLIILEFTVVRFGFVFNLDYSFVGMAQVIWVIGVSMIVMAGLIYLPVWIVGAFGVVMIFFHNLLDGFQVPPATAFGGTPPPDVSQLIWMVLHQQGVFPVGDTSSAFIAYPLIPWVGVMAAGYALGVLYEWDSARRKKWLVALGLVATALFVVMRFVNVYGDPEPWFSRTAFVEKMTARAATEQSTEGGPGDVSPTQVLEMVERSPLSNSTFTLLSFLNTHKYPPSLLFLLMTLGPAMIILALTDRISGKAIWQRIAITFGRVPMFFYLLQFPVAHAMGILLSLMAGKDIGYYFMNMPESMTMAPADHGFTLPVVYAAWIAGLIILYPICWWWGNLKRRNKHWALSYL
jgi:uncharacterized membrane protein